MADLMFLSDPLARLAPTPAPAKPGKLAVGGTVSVGSWHVERTVPPPPRTVLENDYVRFKMLFEGKFEAVGEVKSNVQGTADFKVNAADPQLNVQVGGKVSVTNWLEASAKWKVSPASLEGLEEAARDPKRFGLSLLKYLEVVFGGCIKFDSQYVKFIGAGLTWDTDFCFFSLLVPVTIPISQAGGTVNSGLRYSTTAVVKIGPGKGLLRWLAQTPAGRRAALSLLWSLKRLGRRLPSTLVKEAAGAVQKAANLAGEYVAEDALMLGNTAARMAAWETFCTWASVPLIAIPVSIDLMQFSMHACRKARERGIRDSEYNLFAQAAVRRAYGLDFAFQGVVSNPAVIPTAYEWADDNLLEYGPFYLRTYLERAFNNGRTPVGVRQVDALAERFWLHLRRTFNN